MFAYFTEKREIKNNFSTSVFTFLIKNKINVKKPIF